ncbi:hypothetical protein GE107_15235 [Cohnella sp. CFH 77786]|uniref:hypothetical protein n=1 Tax=Cohnella sp. CFH 77786 TaxID=2662265 RepID=UPI001C60CB3C|nr:hypothetical protein [Cohnella sp. CFH 77786]MBW5447410.1 hypothetical protein [Cohnella sp. CFH 77786]
MNQEQVLMDALERQWQEIRGKRITDPGSRWRGTFELPGDEPSAGLVEIDAFLTVTVPLYCHPASPLFRDREILNCIDGQVEYLLRSQFPSGCISLANCNIDSPPDTGFAVHAAALSYRALDRLAAREDGEAAAEKETLDKLRRFLGGTAECLLTGGIHTPNHRWVIAGALALLYEIFGDERLRERADLYLGEGLDLNGAGEWTERSNAIYNAICGIFLYHAGRVFGYKDLFEPIARNLMMMRYMLHPDDTIVTEYSSRQDRGKPIRLSGEYYVAFRLMASLTGDAEFQAMALKALESPSQPGKSLLYWLVFRERMRSSAEAAALPVRYEVFLNEGREAPVSGAIPHVRTAYHSGSPLVRYRNGDLSVTLMSGQPEFLYVQCGRAKLHGVKLSLGWFGIAGVPMARLERTGERAYELSIVLEGSYRGPLKGDASRPGRTGRSEYDFRQTGREKTHVTRLPVTIGVRLLEDGVDFRVRADGVPHLFAQLAFQFDSEGEVAGPGLESLSDRLRLWKTGSAVYRFGEDEIELWGGAAEHGFRALRNDRHDPDFLHVIANLMTPLDAAVHIRCRKRKEDGGDRNDCED